MFLRFNIKQNQGGHQICVVGSSSVIGAWVPTNSLKINATTEGHFTDEVEITDVVDARDVQYKYTLQHSNSNKVDWEHGENRRINLERYFHQARKISDPNTVLLVTVEDKGFNHKSDNYPKIKTKEVVMEK